MTGSLDKSVITKLAGGSTEAFNDVFTHYSPRILKLGKQFLGSEEQARDLVQDVFSKIWIKRESLTDVENFEVWLWIAARNAALSARRQLAREQLRIEQYMQEHGMPHNNIEKYMNALDYDRIVTQALKKETPRRQLIYKLSREKGLSPKEIALQLDLSSQTVKNEITSVLKTIRGHLESHLISFLLFALFCAF